MPESETDVEIISSRCILTKKASSGQLDKAFPSEDGLRGPYYYTSTSNRYCDIDSTHAQVPYFS